MRKSSKNRLMPFHQDLFKGNTLFDKIARAVCRAGTLPRKELYEAWETARRVRRIFRGCRVVDLACGHGLLAHIMLILDDTSPCALAVDQTIPESAAALSGTLVETWPRLKERVIYMQESLEKVPLSAQDLVVSVHACGHLTDMVLDRAVHSRAKVAVLPCCHDTHTCDTGGLDGWMSSGLAIDAARVLRLKHEGYRVKTSTIPSEITPKNRLLIAEPKSA